MHQAGFKGIQRCLVDLSSLRYTISHPFSRTPSRLHARLYCNKGLQRRQLHGETWRKQSEMWRELVLAYCRYSRIFQLDISSGGEILPFYNASISRKAPHSLVQEILDDMVEACQSEKARGGSGYLIYWKTPSEWAELIHEHIQETGQIGSILTVYDLFHGDDTKGREFHELPEALWSKIFSVLQKEGRVVLFGVDESSGSDKVHAETGLKFMA